MLNWVLLDSCAKEEINVFRVAWHGAGRGAEWLERKGGPFVTDGRTTPRGHAAQYNQPHKQIHIQREIDGQMDLPMFEITVSQGQFTCTKYDAEVEPVSGMEIEHLSAKADHAVTGTWSDE